MLLGIHLTVLMGPEVPVPAAPNVLEALDSVEVSHNDEGHSGFQMSFKIGRSTPFDMREFPLLVNPQVKPFSRVILIVTLNAMPSVLMDGVITSQQLNPGAGPGQASLTVTGEDLSVMMDLEKRRQEHPGQSDMVVVMTLLGNYARYGIVPAVTPPEFMDSPTPVERVPVQDESDLQHIRKLADDYGYVFFVEPGPLPGMNVAYWGPPKRSDEQQRALSVNLGPETNVDSINFQYNALAPTVVKDKVQDSRTDRQMPLVTYASKRPPLAAASARVSNAPNVRTTLLERSSGKSYEQSMARAQAVTDSSGDNVVSVSGDLDTLRYGRILKARGVVGVRGAGFQHDGMYYVKSVSHKIGKGSYKQSFNLTREGTGAISPVVIP